MPTNNREYQKNYMRDYNSKSPLERCSICNKSYKIINRPKHRKNKTHKMLSKFLEGLKTI